MSLITARGTSNLRNERVEQLVHFALSSAFPKNDTLSRRKRVGPKGFQTEFDHYISLNSLHFYGQTTCYKVRGTDGGEPNKTYEMRETLIEYVLVLLSFLENKLDSHKVRFFHVIVGDPGYSYAYFHDLRQNFFDLNIVVNPSNSIENLYKELEQALDEKSLENSQISQRQLLIVYQNKSKKYICKTIDLIKESFESYLSKKSVENPTGIILRKLIEMITKYQTPSLIQLKKISKKGAGIKEKYLEYMKRNETDDRHIIDISHKIMKLRPFLSEAKKSLSNGSSGWKLYNTDLFQRNKLYDKNFRDVISLLWNTPNQSEKELIRRLLMKLPTVIELGSISYPQDIPIKGVNEHNIYTQNFDDEKSKKMIDYILNKFSAVKITKTDQLLDALNKHGRLIIKSGYDYDISNGTVVKPTLYYVTSILNENGFEIKSTKSALGDTIKGFHSDVFGVDTGSFNSLTVIQKDGKNIALFKAKFFRPQEFDRRVKEESFVSFMSYFRVKKGKDKYEIEKDYPDLARIMFIDTAKDFFPDNEAIRVLTLLGWQIFFSIDELISYLEEVSGKELRN